MTKSWALYSVLEMGSALPHKTVERRDHSAVDAAASDTRKHMEAAFKSRGKIPARLRQAEAV
ncbi:hypothetical protein [Sphingomonas sp. GM_Shp_2]|uniref:hypothetical protein n=1 Tax=Sphingomonas sp. GM_Shp_2 TaxID=2937380 RepID=UPI002269FA65|nr:hypothetical protein [Sphingomonas sp. GM_Shp_2]